jgi:hypothetical protein
MWDQVNFLFHPVFVIQNTAQIATHTEHFLIFKNCDFSPHFAFFMHAKSSFFSSRHLSPNADQFRCGPKDFGLFFIIRLGFSSSWLRFSLRSLLNFVFKSEFWGSFVLDFGFFCWVELGFFGLFFLDFLDYFLS